MMATFGAALPLLLGALLAVAALGFVLWPLWTEATSRPTARPRATRPTPHVENPIEALREVEFDRATGKLSDEDYAALKARYTQQALVEMRSADATAQAAAAPTSGAAESLDPVEAEVLRYRARRRDCARCGPRPEADAVFCSECGRYLSERCGACGASVEDPTARFCTRCGDAFASVA